VPLMVRRVQSCLVCMLLLITLRRYYAQDEEAGRLMTQTLTTLPPSQRPPFARLQASVRSGYHAHVSARRNAEYQAHLSATAPGGSLTAHSRLDPNGPAARKERCQRFESFIHTWCTLGMPGTQPFFEALWAVMRLQVVPQNLGGAGSRRIEWEIDDAVFKEAAGKDFMLEAIDVLKGVRIFYHAVLTSPDVRLSKVLAFDEAAAPLSPSSSVSAPYPITPVHARAQSQPLFSSSKTSVLPPMSPPIATTAFAKRPRAPSDPFLDAPPLPSSRSPATNSSTASNSQGSDLADDASISAPPPDDVFVSEAQQDPFFESESQMRIWRSPDITNPEYLALLKLFPAFVSGRPLPRFPVASFSKRKPDIEEAEEPDEDVLSVRFGTGTITLGSQERSDGWQGKWWTRFVMWWRTLFC
jgi:hypothetical protein